MGTKQQPDDMEQNLRGKVEVLSVFSDNFWEVAERNIITGMNVRLDCKNVETQQQFSLTIKLVHTNYDRSKKEREVHGLWKDKFIVVTYKGKAPKSGELRA